MQQENFKEKTTEDFKKRSENNSRPSELVVKGAHAERAVN